MLIGGVLEGTDLRNQRRNHTPQIRKRQVSNRV
jgi:hypothetical protein